MQGSDGVVIGIVQSKVSNFLPTGVSLYVVGNSYYSNSSNHIIPSDNCSLLSFQTHHQYEVGILAIAFIRVIIMIISSST